MVGRTDRYKKRMVPDLFCCRGRWPVVNTTVDAAATATVPTAATIPTATIPTAVFGS